MVILKTKTGMIPANETEIVFTDVNIEDSSIIEVYYDDNNVYTLETWQSGDDVHIITSPHSNQVGVKLLINNVDSFTPYDDTNIKQRVSTLESNVVTIDNKVTTLETDVETLETKVEELNASNISYDEHSTLYSAMGDIDELETTSKNLVGAINENFTSVSNGKSLVASAITDKGVPTASDATFQTMADNISQISGGGGGEEGYIAYTSKPFKKEDLVSYTCANMRGNITLGDNTVTIQSTTTGNNYTYGGMIGVYVEVDVTDFNLIMFETTRNNTNGRIHTFALNQAPTTLPTGSTIAVGDSTYGRINYPTDASSTSRYFIDVSSYSGVRFIGISNTAPSNTMTLRRMFALK